MKRKVLLVMFLSVLSLGLLSATHLAVQPLNNAPGAADAAELFKKNCATCHGSDGRAKTTKAKFNGARNLTKPEWQAEATDERIMNAIKKGPGAMPSFEKKFTQAEIESLVAFVRTLKREEQDEKKK
jgi:mono/diheme cytochrome c family protein